MVAASLWVQLYEVRVVEHPRLLHDLCLVDIHVRMLVPELLELFMTIFDVFQFIENLADHTLVGIH